MSSFPLHFVAVVTVDGPDDEKEKQIQVKTFNLNQKWVWGCFQK